MRRWSIENNRFDDAVGRRYGIGPADMHALEELEVSGGLTPGQLCARLQLTSGSVTALADRLERLGFIRRVPHPTDRRTSVLRLTELVEGFAREAYEPFGEDMLDLVETMPEQVRGEMTRFFEEAADIAARHAERQAELRRAARPAPPAR
jgi:DNA-binding MarR family transcriptional regulator